MAGSAARRISVSSEAMVQQEAPSQEYSDTCGQALVTRRDPAFVPAEELYIRCTKLAPTKKLCASTDYDHPQLCFVWPCTRC
jgi:hypothetical protein